MVHRGGTVGNKKKSDNEIQHLEDVFQPRKLQVLFLAIKKVTGFKEVNFKRANLFKPVKGMMMKK